MERLSVDTQSQFSHTNMANSIEIFENTLLKLLVRRGPDSDRLAITLTSGELGYTTDTKRLYIGDGSTVGGILVGNTYAGSSTNVTTLAPACIGDLAYDSDNYKLYRLQANDGSSINDWEYIGGVYTPADDTITITADNKISVGTLSGNNFSPSGIQSPLYITSNQLALSSVVPVDKLIPKTTTNVELFSSLKIRGNVYNFPPSGYVANGFLRDRTGNGDLDWTTISLSAVSSGTLTVTSGLTASANGVNVTGTTINPLTANVVIGLSPTLSARNIYARYDGSISSILATKGILSATKESIGNYTFYYTDVGTDYPSITPAIINNLDLDYVARVAYAGRTQCAIIVYNRSDYTFSDQDISIQILA